MTRTRRVFSTIAAAVLAGTMAIGAPAVADAHGRGHGHGHHKVCVKPIPPDYPGQWKKPKVCKTPLNRRTRIHLPNGPVTLTPGFDNQFATPFRADDHTQLAVFINRTFVGYTPIYDDQGTVLVQPSWPWAKKGYQKIAFYNMDGQLVGWDWVNVTWDW